MKNIIKHINLPIKILVYLFENNPIYLVPYRIFDLIRLHYVVNFKKRIISKKLFNGKQIFLFPGCNVSSLFFYTDIPDKQEIMFLRQNSNGRTVFIDIGANVGSYSILMMDKVKNILAFEPHPYTHSRCKMNFILNGYSEKNVNQIAISDKNQKVHFSDYGGSSSINSIIQANNGIKVNTITLDKFVAINKLAKSDEYIIKIDVEGFEQKVLDGAKKFINSYHIKGILFESFGNKKNIIYKFLQKNGFNIQQISTNNHYASKTY